MLIAKFKLISYYLRIYNIYFLAWICRDICRAYNCCWIVSKGYRWTRRLLDQGISDRIVMSLLTLLPETILAIVESISGHYGIALGSSIRDNVILFTLDIGLVRIIYKLKIDCKI